MIKGNTSMLVCFQKQCNTLYHKFLKLFLSSLNWQITWFTYILHDSCNKNQPTSNLLLWIRKLMYWFLFVVLPCHGDISAFADPFLAQIHVFRKPKHLWLTTSRTWIAQWRKLGSPIFDMGLLLGFSMSEALNRGYLGKSWHFPRADSCFLAA